MTPNTFTLLLLFFCTTIFAQQGTWEYIHTGNSCANHGESGSCMQGRHEASYVQVGDKFYLIGGREHNSNVNIYDPKNDSWTVGANAPFSIHHFQAVEYQGLILIIGAMTGGFPNETPLDKIIIYDPLNNKWLDGPTIPANRRRGSAGVVVDGDKIYLVCGIQNGHKSGWVPWLDEYNLTTNTWTVLKDAPHSRDHFHAAFANNKIYVGGGRRSGEDGTFNATEGAIDIYDLNSKSWSTNAKDMPTHRAAPCVAVIGDEVLFIGGEKESGSANKETEALNINTGNWRTLTSLNKGRHGTQAIVNNENIWIASGSPNRGGGNTQSQERFYFGNPVNPTLSTNNKSSLETPNSTNINNGTSNISLKNTNGNQAILVQSISLSGSNSFSMGNLPALPFLLKSGASFELPVAHSGSDNQTGQIKITHTGANSSNTIDLTAEKENIPPETSTPENENIAPLGTASQSSTAYGGVATRAIDKNTNGRYGARSVTHTSNTNQPWWQVTWSEEYRIDQIKIYNRTNCCSSRLSNFTVSITDNTGKVTFSKTYSASPNPSLTINTDGVKGGRVKVQLNKKSPLSLAEVEVFGVLVQADENIAPLGNASQSSTAHGGVAARAIDENTNGRYGARSVTHTNNSNQPWWQVVWNEAYKINQIKIYNRTDCCSSRLSNFTVSVRDNTGKITFSKTYSNSPNPSLIINTGGVNGSQVRVQLNGRSALSLAEVEVFGTPISLQSRAATSISHFSAQKEIGRKVALTWLIDQQNNPIDYEVEYKTADGTYEVLDIIPADNTTNFQSYKFLHHDPVAGENTYRIRVNYEANVVTYLDPKKVAFADVDKIKAFPNPSVGTLFIDLNAYANKEVKLALFDVSGNQQLTAHFGKNHQSVVQLDLSMLQNGLYVLYIKAENNRTIARKINLIRGY